MGVDMNRERPGALGAIGNAPIVCLSRLVERGIGDLSGELYT